MDSGTTTGDEPGAAERHDLPDDVNAAGLARDKARRFVGRLRMEAVVEPLTLIVSESVSNAVRHGKPPIQLPLQWVGRGVRVDVHDGVIVVTDQPGRLTAASKSRLGPSRRSDLGPAE